MSLKEVVFSGPAGRLEGKCYQNDDKSAPIAVVLHPSPARGGSMHNRVVHNIFHCFIRQGFSVLRFNFRGVGKSAGTFDHGPGEMSDAAAALDWMQSENPDAANYWLAGFSFGAWIAMQLVMRRPEIHAFIAVSPPANLYDFNFLSPCSAHGLIIQGTGDKMVSEPHVHTLYQRLDKQRNSNVEYVPIENADHFFSNHEQELINVLESYIAPRFGMEHMAPRSKRDRRRRTVMFGEGD